MPSAESFGSGSWSAPPTPARCSTCGARCARAWSTGYGAECVADATDRGRGSATEPQPRRDDDGETKRVASGMFSGSPEAEARARAFDEHADYEDEFARSTNGSG